MKLKHLKLLSLQWKKSYIFVCMNQVRTLLLLFCAIPFLSFSKGREKRPVVRLETNLGVIRIALNDDTPIHRDNFLKLVSDGFYDGLLFHRVVRDYIIQAGDPESRNAPRGKKLGTGGPGYTLPAEIDWPYTYHVRGAVAMARDPDEVNPERRSNGSQFYIVWGKYYTPSALQKVQPYVWEQTGGIVKFNYEQTSKYEQYGGTPNLDGQYTVFGEVIDGLSVVKKIQKCATDSLERPLEDVVILRAAVEQKPSKKK